MIDIKHESILRLTEAARLVGNGRGNKPACVPTIWRWILKGAKGPNGEIVRLEALKIGSAWKTSKEALQRFFERLTPNLDTPPPSKPRTPNQRRKAHAKAVEKLRALGM